MIISFPTQSGMYTFCLNASLLKLLAGALAAILLIAGYAVVQLGMFILNATPEQFFRIVLFTAFIAGVGFFVRFLLSKKLRGAI